MKYEKGDLVDLPLGYGYAVFMRYDEYFNSLADTLEVGDLIYCVTSTGSTAVATLVYVLSNSSGVVDVNDGTTLANTDTD